MDMFQNKALAVTYYPLVFHIKVDILKTESLNLRAGSAGLGMATAVHPQLPTPTLSYTHPLTSQAPPLLR